MTSRSRTREVRVEVRGERESAMEFIGAWKRAARGAARQGATERIYFLDAATLLRTLSNRRLDLLQTLRTRGPMTIRALSRLLGRDYKNVHADVKLLRRVGLVESASEGRVSVPWDRIAAEIALAA